MGSNRGPWRRETEATPSKSSHPVTRDPGGPQAEVIESCDPTYTHTSPYFSKFFGSRNGQDFKLVDPRPAPCRFGHLAALRAACCSNPSDAYVRTARELLAVEAV